MKAAKQHPVKSPVEEPVRVSSRAGLSDNRADTAGSLSKDSDDGDHRGKTQSRGRDHAGSPQSGQDATIGRRRGGGQLSPSPAPSSAPAPAPMPVSASARAPAPAPAPAPTPAPAPAPAASGAQRYAPEPQVQEVPSLQPHPVPASPLGIDESSDSDASGSRIPLPSIAPLQPRSSTPVYAQPVVPFSSSLPPRPPSPAVVSVISAAPGSVVTESSHGQYTSDEDKLSRNRESKSSSFAEAKSGPAGQRSGARLTGCLRRRGPSGFKSCYLVLHDESVREMLLLPCCASAVAHLGCLPVCVARNFS
jgi:hypothetical protein